MMYYQWIVAALGVIAAYMIAGYLWAWWTQRRNSRRKNGK